MDDDNTDTLRFLHAFGLVSPRTLFHLFVPFMYSQIIDTGIYSAYQGGSEINLRGGYSAVDGETSWNDINGHGT